MTTEVRIAAKTTRRRTKRAAAPPSPLTDEAIAAVVRADHSDLDAGPICHARQHRGDALLDKIDVFKGSIDLTKYLSQG